jgi:hypothetical protein
MSNERQEHLLLRLFGIVYGFARPEEVTERRAPKLVEEVEGLAPNA